MPAVKLFQETLGVCMFGYLDVKMETIVEAYKALTGLPLSVETALVTADRIDHVQRAFNVRHGFKPEMDIDVCPRLLEAPVDGPNKGKAMGSKWVGLVKDYNRLKEWDWETGRPSREKLEQLELAGIADDLWGKGGGR